MIILNAKGIFSSNDNIVLNSTRTINWKQLSDKNPPQIPDGISIELSISIDENEFLSGKKGIVWATYDLLQAEIIQNTLLAQHINCETKRIVLEPALKLELELELKSMFLLSISNDNDVNTASDFIWKGDSGLRLKPDWSYPKGETNKSFEQWLNGQ